MPEENQQVIRKRIRDPLAKTKRELELEKKAEEVA
jgi:hypothetical protein